MLKLNSKILKSRHVHHVVTFYIISNANHSYLWVGVEEQKCWIAKKWNSKWVPLQPTWLVGRRCIILSSQKWKEAWQSKGFLEEIEKVDRYKKIFVTKYNRFMSNRYFLKTKSVWRHRKKLILHIQIMCFLGHK